MISGVDSRNGSGTSPSGTLDYDYGYDYLWRLTEASLPGTESWAEKGITYDRNGNLRSLTRHGGSGSILDALNLSYSGNRLAAVSHPGGTWSYGHEGSGRMTSDGRLGGIAVQYGETGLPRRTMGPPGSGITTTEYSYLADETRLGVAQNRGSGPKDAQRKVNKGQGPKDIKRIDAPNISENSQWHAHGKNGSAINIDGTVHDKHRGNPPFARRTLNWLQEHGWDIDNYIQNQK